MPGIEDRMMVMWQLGVNSGKFSPSRFVELMSTNPAKIFGCYPQKGTIAVGTEADIVVWDPKATHTISASTHHMRCDYNVYEGMKVTGVPQKVYLRGNSSLMAINGTAKTEKANTSAAPPVSPSSNQNSRSVEACRL